jgi:hypothetical protein
MDIERKEEGIPEVTDEGARRRPISAETRSLLESIPV